MNVAEKSAEQHLRELDVRIAKMMVEIEKLHVEIRREQKSTAKIVIESYFYPFGAISALLGAAIGVIKLFS
ncbi:MAG: hypothetical protein Q4D61_08915 [Cardiobacteriaceae bacterium]|nr:hypothetical protein [Cardiobacteriaceae bacterium]